MHHGDPIKPRPRMRRRPILQLTALVAAVAASAAPAVAQTGEQRVGDWSISRLGAAEGGAICMATRLYGRGYGLEVIQAKSRPGLLILRLESPEITWPVGALGEEIEPGETLWIVIGNTSGQEGSEAIVREGPRGKGFVTSLREEPGAQYTPIRNLRTGRSLRAFVALPDGSEDKLIGDYSLAGSGAALDALTRCTNEEVTP